MLPSANNTNYFELDSRYSTTRSVIIGDFDAASSYLCTASKQNQLAKNYSSNLLEDDKNKIEGGLRLKGYKKISHSDFPLITVVTSVYNGEKYLEDCIISVINQSYSNVEYIIIDGGSTGNTIDILRRYDHVIDYWISEKDNGIYDAWNKSLHLASGDYIAFIGSDDVYIPEALNEFVSLLKKNPKLEYVSGRVQLFSDKRNLRIIGKPWVWKKFRRYMCSAHVGSLHSRSLFVKHGLFNTIYRIAGDYEFLLRAGPTLKAGYVNSLVARMLKAVASRSALQGALDVVAFGGGAFNAEELAIVGTLGFAPQAVRQVGRGDEVLGTLYAAAAAFVYPSVYEGFGLPPLEAMAHNCPVVTSNSSSMPEVVGNAGEYFDPLDIEAQSDAICKVVFNAQRRSQLIELGRQRLEMFSWDRCALETQAVYQRVLRNKGLL